MSYRLHNFRAITTASFIRIMLYLDKSMHNEKKIVFEVLDFLIGGSDVDPVGCTDLIFFLTFKLKF